MKSAHNFINLTGQHFSRLVVVSYHGKNQFREALWECQCDCGEVTIVPGSSLRSNLTKSCGCWKTEEPRIRMTRHGHARRNEVSSEHISWSAMLARCGNPKQDNYKYYGGRGITVCKRWQKFENFLADMGLKPTPKHSIERKDNNKGYSPSNCIWATHTQQMANRGQAA